MNLYKIRQILDTGLITDDYKCSLIMDEIAKDKNVIPYILRMIESERNEAHELIRDSTAELSRALVVLSDENVTANKKAKLDPKWLAGEIKNHFLKWKDNIRCGFKIDGLP